MKHLMQLYPQLKNSKLTVKYSEANGGELACIWEENSDDESLLVINRIKIDANKLHEHVEHDKEFVVNLFFEPNKMEESISERLSDIVKNKYIILEKFKHQRRGQIISKQIGF